MRYLDSLRPYLRLDVALGAVVVLAFAAGLYFYQGRGAARTEAELVEAQLPIAGADLSAMEEESAFTQGELARKQEELGLKQEEAQAKELETGRQKFASRTEALGLSERLIAFAAESGLVLGNFETEQATTTIAAIEFHTVTYALVATGKPDLLIGLVDIVGEAATARVGKLEFARDPEETDVWVMTLGLAVIYAEDG